MIRNAQKLCQAQERIVKDKEGGQSERGMSPINWCPGMQRKIPRLCNVASRVELSNLFIMWCMGVEWCFPMEVRGWSMQKLVSFVSGED